MRLLIAILLFSATATAQTGAKLPISNYNALPQYFLMSVDGKDVRVQGREAMRSKLDSTRIYGDTLYEWRNGVRSVAGLLPRPNAVYLMLPAGTSATGTGVAGNPVVVSLNGGFTSITDGTTTSGKGTIAPTTDVTGQVSTLAAQLAGFTSTITALQAEIARLKADTIPILIGPKLKYENKVLDIR